MSLPKRCFATQVLVVALVLVSSGMLRAQNNFLRGDVNCDGCVDLIDSYVMGQVLFQNMTPPCACREAYDVNLDGSVTVADTVYLLSFLVLGGLPPGAPYPVCGPGTGGLGCTGYPSPCPLFKRGDANQDGCVSPQDSTFIAAFLFTGGPAPACMLSADANDDDVVDNRDVIYILRYCNGGAPPPAPGPLVCGADPTPGVLACASYPQRACSAGCRNQLAGDCNQDGGVDISDVVCTLGNLFIGIPALLSCGDGATAHPSNVALLDCDGSLVIDISDAIWLLAYLFGNGPPPVAGTGCIYIPQCPQNIACPSCTP